MNKVLIAEDDRITRRTLELILAEWGYETVAVQDGLTAWEVLQQPDGPRLALLDWLMPGLDGLEICRRVRALPTRQPPYLILLTVRDSRQDMVAGLQGGADDYIAKPFDQEELHARLQTGLRILRLQRATLPSSFARARRPCRRSNSSRGFCPFAAIARRFATTRTTGAKSRNTFPPTPRPVSAMASARRAGRAPYCRNSRRWADAVEMMNDE